ncbi:MAG TPA: DUF2865 domain-containing protein [Xanthobacteraceae bacterium]|nr:DUF2865 domain-containing protein [Xanthobacteraceae bacterium]
MAAWRGNIRLRRKVLPFAAAALITAVSAGSASAGLLDFLFGRHSSAPSLPQAVAPLMRALGNPFAPSREEIPPERGPSVAYCVRLCDGHPFPIQNNGSSLTQTCQAACPAAATEVFAGGSIDSATAANGKRYASLPNAFVYRKQIVNGCTCNGRTPGGLVTMNVRSDPTLRPGDIVATNDGLAAFGGMKNQTAEFTPVQSYKGLSADMRRKLSAMEVRTAPVPAGVMAAAPPADPAAADEKHRAQLSR